MAEFKDIKTLKFFHHDLTNDTLYLKQYSDEIAAETAAREAADLEEKEAREAADLEEKEAREAADRALVSTAEEQAFNDSEKETGRNNIGAAASADLASAYNYLLDLINSINPGDSVDENEYIFKPSTQSLSQSISISSSSLKDEHDILWVYNNGGFDKNVYPVITFSIHYKYDWNDYSLNTLEYIMIGHEDIQIGLNGEYLTTGATIDINPRDGDNHIVSITVCMETGVTIDDEGETRTPLRIRLNQSGDSLSTACELGIEAVISGYFIQRKNSNKTVRFYFQTPDSDYWE